MYIENNSLVIIPNKNNKLPQLFIINDKKPICVCNKYSLIPSKRENVQLSILEDAHLYFKKHNNIYISNPRRHEIIRLFHFIKKNKWEGSFYLLFNI
ncbi:SWPV1-227 [Shearwaterpox virus]|uniref:SWPV1-227 n=1 Tax=Shearwaterpox virus TaxID=1974596 RepID=A0A1V0QGX0_CNPV|nr:SWPV1-227 [Shearwaterpox virus]